MTSSGTSYPPPNPIPLPSIFNDIYFSDYNSTLTIRVADFRYLRKDGDTMIGQLNLNSTLLPALGFSSDPSSGLYYPGLNEIGFATNGMQRLRITNTFSQFLNSELRVAHTNLLADPKFTLYANRVSGNQICQSTLTQKSTDATDKALVFQNTTADLTSTDISYRFLSGSGSSEHQISNRLQNLGVSGSVSVPTYSFQVSGNAGIYYLNGVAFTHGSVQRMLISNSGVRIGASGTDIPTFRFGNSTNSGSTSYTVSFGYTFTSAPTVSTVCVRNDTSNQFIIQLLNVTTTNFTYRLVVTSIANPSQTYAGTDSHGIHWIAIGA